VKPARIVLLLVVAILVSPLAAAQPNPSLTLSANPRSADASPGADSPVTVTVQNAGLTPLTVTIDARADRADLNVTFTGNPLTILPMQSQQVSARLHVSTSASLGDVHVTFFAREWTNSTAPFTLHVVQNATTLPDANNTTSTTPPPANTTKSSDSDLPPEGNGTTPVDNSTRTPSNATQPKDAPSDPAPVADPKQETLGTPPPANDSAPNNSTGAAGRAAAIDYPTSQLIPSPSRLIVSPTLLILPPGGTGAISIVADTLAPVTLIPPDGYESTLTDAGGGVWTFQIHATPSAIAFATRNGTVTAGNATARFQVRVESDAGLAATTVALQSKDGGISPAWGIGAASLGAIALAGAWVHRRWPFAFAILYSRIAPARLLAHPARDRMLAHVRADPGLHARELQRRLELAHGVFSHHLQRLQEGGLLRVVPDGALRRLYPTGTATPAPTPPLGKRALDAITRRGSVSAAILADELGVSRQALHYHLKRLAIDGRIRGVTQGRELILTPA
jgi:DNA-binding transcriptional ArsR family regulator